MKDLFRKNHPFQIEDNNKINKRAWKFGTRHNMVFQIDDQAFFNFHDYNFCSSKYEFNQVNVMEDYDDLPDELLYILGDD